MWILYEIAEFILTSDVKTITMSDVEKFAEHVQEMLQTGVRSVQEKYGYRCSYDCDKAFLTSWLEILVLPRTLRVDIDDTRMLMDRLTWSPTSENISMAIDGGLQLSKFEGILVYNGEQHTFTPFPKWVSLLVPVTITC